MSNEPLGELWGRLASLRTWPICHGRRNLIGPVQWARKTPLGRGPSGRIRGRGRRRQRITSYWRPRACHKMANRSTMDPARGSLISLLNVLAPPPPTPPPAANLIFQSRRSAAQLIASSGACSQMSILGHRLRLQHLIRAQPLLQSYRYRSAATGPDGIHFRPLYRSNFVAPGRAARVGQNPH